MVGNLDDTPAGAIARLDDALKRRGQTVTVRRLSGPADLQVLANVRGYKPSELVGGIAQGDTSIVLSPTGLAAFVPLKRGDKIVIDGALKNVEAANNIKMANILVRINLQVRG